MFDFLKQATSMMAGVSPRFPGAFDSVNHRLVDQKVNFFERDTSVKDWIAQSLTGTFLRGVKMCVYEAKDYCTTSCFSLP